MFYTGERAIPWDHRVGWVMDHHAMRYAWALRYCHDLAVCDLGSGAGYGSYMLSWVAERVVGVEIDAEAFGYAGNHFQASNLAWRCMDVMDVEVLPRADVYVAFEVLEHLDDPQSLVDSVDGLLVWSVPVLDDSRFHKHIYSAAGAIEAFGGSIWYQSPEGYIVPRECATFEPHNVLGVR